MSHSLAVCQSQPIVSLTDVCLQFGDFAALTKVDFEIFPGQTLALLGHNGAGKSSLIKLILGLYQPTRGQINIADKKQLNLGYLPEDVSFYDKLTGKEVLSYFAALKQVNPSKVNQLIEEFELGYAQHRPLKTYSKGMKQRLGVAQAILSEPQVLLLDEPTVGLDPQASQFLYKKIDQLKHQGCAVVVCTHELAMIEQHLDRAFLMAKGHKLASGTLSELRKLSGLNTHITMTAIEQRIKGDRYLQSLCRDNALEVGTNQRDEMIKYLVATKNITDFNVLEPSLMDVYRYFMRQVFELETSAATVQPSRTDTPLFQQLLRYFKPQVGKGHYE
ncbi:ABC transporter ATP-binding protein [Shewanella intestini]|uniref:ABC transporter ATP-binding protein n=1 Tax=Shewanella intestini TaxID=2017544 RepID=A0ABS5I438_9GAMM|nr:MULTISPECIES: ABC transporter ATP-binding protein [Shewanella]MBR9728786.1 ABC transporter ATP-binding protein [Shewanella intestini]MRG36861.1 ATP-binding cassette domain-containing protein [Shewanella sp. XMDDZSB0408]